VFAGARYFERLLTRFSVPEELFGPLSLRALEDDRYERLTDGFLPTAQVAFLDEVFKANSAILNALLTLLNEREFDNGSGRVAVPLISVVGATNEVPDDEALQAFYDRFCCACRWSRWTMRTLPRLLQLAAQGEPALSDRRWRQVVALARTAAAAEGRTALDALDLWLAPYVAAARPEAVPALQAWVDDAVFALPPAQAPWLERAVQAFEQQLSVERQMPSEDGDDGAGKLALARALGGTSGDGGGMAAHRLRATGRAACAPLEPRAHRRARGAGGAGAGPGGRRTRAHFAQQAAAHGAGPGGPRGGCRRRCVQRVAARPARVRCSWLDAMAARLADTCHASFAALPCDAACRRRRAARAGGAGRARARARQAAT
jgi:MoxR-like ATPase